MADEKPGPEQSRITLRTSEAAERLGLCERTVRDWANQGILPSIRVGRTILIPLKDLETWAAERSTGGSVGAPARAGLPPQGRTTGGSARQRAAAAAETIHFYATGGGAYADASKKPSGRGPKKKPRGTPED